MKIYGGEWLLIGISIQLKKIGGNSQAIRVGVCCHDVKFDTSPKQSEFCISGTWDMYKVCPPFCVGDVVGVFVDIENLFMVIYKNYTCIRKVQFNRPLIKKVLSDEIIFPCVALCDDIHVIITHQPNIQNYKNLPISGEYQTIVGKKESMNDFLDTLGVVKFKHKLVSFTLESLTLEDLERMEIPTILKNKLWNTRNEILSG